MLKITMMNGKEMVFDDWTMKGITDGVSQINISENDMYKLILMKPAIFGKHDGKKIIILVENIMSIEEIENNVQSKED